VTLPRQHLPEGFFTSQAQLPAFTSVVIRSAMVERPVGYFGRSAHGNKGESVGTVDVSLVWNDYNMYGTSDPWVG
jgi:hypothetical protein